MQREITLRCILCLIALVALAAPAHAQVAPSSSLDARTAREEPRLPSESRRSAEQAAEQGLLLPFTQSPQVDTGRAVAKVLAGYDSALDDFVARSSADARLLPLLSLRVDFDHGPGMGPRDRFGVGAKLQVLRRSSVGIDAALGLAYQPNDFREEGHIVASALLGRSFGRFQLFANALLGSDPEGDDRAIEARLSALYRAVQRLHLGLDTRFRLNASEDEKRAGTETIDWELQATPTASLGLGPIALLGQAGLSVIQSTGPFGTGQQQTSVKSGVLVMAGAAGAF